MMNTSTNTGTATGYVVTPSLGVVPSVFVPLRRARRDQTGTGRPARSAHRGGRR